MNALQKGTPENPAFWTRPLLDLPFAAGKFSIHPIIYAYNTIVNPTIQL